MVEVAAETEDLHASLANARARIKALEGRNKELETLHGKLNETLRSVFPQRISKVVLRLMIAEVERDTLRAAVEPFAAVVRTGWGSSLGDGFEMILHRRDTPFATATLTIGDFRRAQRALVGLSVDL